jgi:TonB-dependent receptor
VKTFKQKAERSNHGKGQSQGATGIAANGSAIFLDAVRSRRAATPGLAAATGAALLLMGAGEAQAQQAPAPAADNEELESVVVTGIRAGIDNAIALKKESSSIVEAVSAEDIGKLPDTSIADSISRLPGLTSQRAEGRASAISLRGTDPGFTTALLNGREQVSTGDNRSIEFDQYPSELLSAVVVYKTPDSQLVGQGLAGTIDLRTRRPLEYSDRAIVFNIRAEQNSHNDLGADGDDTGYRASFSYVDQYMDDTLGLTIGFAHLVSPLATQGAGTYEPWHANGNPTDPNPGVIINPGVGPDTYITDGIKVRTDMGENRRDGAMAALQWKPSDTYSSVLDVYYTEREQTDNARSLEVNLGGYPGPCCDGTPAPGTYGYSNPSIEDNTVVSATLNNRVPLARNFLFTTKDKIFATGWNNTYSTEKWSLGLDLSYSKAERDEQQYETNAQMLPNLAAPAGTPRNVYDTGQFSIGRDRMPHLSFLLDYADPSVVQVGPTIYGAGYSKIPHVEDELESARVDYGLNLETGWFSKLSAGVNYADRTKDKFQPEGNLNTIGNGYHQVSADLLEKPTNLDYANAGQALAWDVKGVLAAYYQPIVYGTPTTPGFDYLIGKNWTVEEKVATVFVKADLDHEISDSVHLRGNIGLQYVDTDQSSQAFYKDNSTNQVLPIDDGKTYSDVLPAVNLAFQIADRHTVRVGLAQELARARMDQLKASSEFGYSAATGIPGGNGGNPHLDPWRADAYDLSYELYFGEHKGYMSIAAFYKNLKSYIYNQVNGNYDFSDYLATLPPNYFAPGVVPETTGSFSQPINGKGGDLSGIEFAVSLPGELFTDALTGFGVNLSYSYTDSGIKIQDPPGNNFNSGNNLGEIPLPGLSKDVWNATVYYERAGFSARVATRARSKYIGEVTNFANDRSLKYVMGDQITDAQLGYEFGEGHLSGLSILLQMNNITNEPYIAYAVSETRQQDFQEYGRQLLLGINYKL